MKDKRTNEQKELSRESELSIINYELSIYPADSIEFITLKARKKQLMLKIKGWDQPMPPISHTET